MTRVSSAVSDARPQSRLCASGIIRKTETIIVGNSPTFRCEFSDGSEEIDLLFLGREMVPGLDAGRHATVEGMVGRHQGMLVVWNPSYQLAPRDDDVEWHWYPPNPEAA
jgi:hypothetical protein